MPGMIQVKVRDFVDQEERTYVLPLPVKIEVEEPFVWFGKVDPHGFYSTRLGGVALYMTTEPIQVEVLPDGK